MFERRATDKSLIEKQTVSTTTPIDVSGAWIERYVARLLRCPPIASRVIAL
jgi:hypothetical protein